MGLSDFEDIENDGDSSPELDIGKDEYILHGASVFFIHQLNLAVMCEEAVQLAFCCFKCLFKYQIKFESRNLKNSNSKDIFSPFWLLIQK